MRLDRVLLVDRLLLVLQREPSSPMTAAQLAARLGASHANVTTVLRLLIAAGQVERTAAPDLHAGSRGYRPLDAARPASHLSP